MTTYKPKPTFKFTPVKIIILCILFLNVISLTSLYSSLHQGGQLVGADIFYKQLTWIAFGWIIFILFCFINYRFYYDLSFIFYGINIFLLLLVYILGTTAMGAQRWISIFGFNFQPSEISKVAILFILARFFSNKEQQGTLREVLIPFALVAFNALLIIKQPDLGTGLILFFLFFIMGFYSRLPKRYFVILMMIGLMLLPVGWKILKDYQKKRLIVFMNPDVDPLGAGYTIIQSKIAIGSGKVAGKGFLSGTQNQFNFLPERHTDFIFTVVAEEWGFIGSLFLLLIYWLILYKMLSVMRKAKDQFAKFLLLGISAIYFLHLFINIGMTLGILPVVGLPLIFLSYGGSNLLINFILAGIFVNIARNQ